MSAKGYLVTMKDSNEPAGFLGHRGKAVREFPDARVFETSDHAYHEAEKLSARGIICEVMSVAAYDTGAA